MAAAIFSSWQLDALRRFCSCTKTLITPATADLKSVHLSFHSGGAKTATAIRMAASENAITTSISSLGQPKQPTWAVPVLERLPDGTIHISSHPHPPQLSTFPDKSSEAANVPAKRAPASKNLGKGPPKYSKAARRFYNETFREPERLSKVLATAGVASRRACEDIIFAGRVTVNGTVCKVPQTPVDPLRDFIYIDGCSLPKKLPPKLFFALNKPKGYICSNGTEESKSVLSLFNEFIKSWTKKNPGVGKPRLFTVGRLDVGTSGLLLVTNDGEFAHKVSHPSSGITKEYIATIDGETVTKRQLNAIAQGTPVQGVLCVPKEVELLDGEADDQKKRVRIVVSEGRHHEVRLLVENAGCEVHALKRVRIGSLRLPRKLRVGKYQVLTEQEANKILAGI